MRKISANPFAKASSQKEKDKIWNSLKRGAKRISKEEANKRINSAIELQTKKENHH